MCSIKTREFTKKDLRQKNRAKQEKIKRNFKMTQRQALEQNWPRPRKMQEFKRDASRIELSTDRLFDTSVLKKYGTISNRQKEN